MSDLPTLMAAVTALVVGSAALLAVNRLRPVVGRLAAGLAGIMLIAYGAVTTADAATPLVQAALTPEPPEPMTLRLAMMPASAATLVCT